MAGSATTTEKKSFFGRFKGEKKDKTLVVKEKKQKKKKKQKQKKVAPVKEGSKKNFFGKEKKTPREELNNEIETLKQQLATTKGELHDTRIQYNELQRWAQSAPVRR